MSGSRPISRRQMLRMAVQGGVSATVLAACGPAQPQQGGTAGGGTAPGGQSRATGEIDFLAWGDSADLPGWDALIKRYAEINPELKINLTTVAEPNNNFYPKLQTAIAGGKPPHLASFQGWEWQTYADRGLLQPLDELIARDKLGPIYEQDIPALKDTTARNGQRFLVPLQLATMVMFYARKPFDQAGIAYPTDDWTYAQFVDAARRLTDLSGDTKRFGFQTNGNWFRDIHWIRSTGKREFDSLVDPRRASFNQPELVEIIQQVAQDFQYGQQISPKPADLQGGANTINTGNSAMKYEGPWFLSQLNSPKLRQDGKEVPFDVVLMPQGADAGRPHRGWSEGVAIFKSDRVEQAWAFASFAASEEGQKIYSAATGRMPNTLGLIESFWLPTVQETFQITNGKAFTEALRRSQVDVIGKVPRSKMWAEVVKPLGWDPLQNNSAKAADVLPRVDEALQKLLDA
ncbi:MAG TPA: extracellular solute-binding protein [Roseiflexaceae bacterium]|nr:extracellular solute-binding protein [Roseiflexaceae bacterium]